MYEVNVKANPEHFLDWDKPLSEQSKHVQDTITKVMGPYEDTVRRLDYGPGSAKGGGNYIAEQTLRQFKEGPFSGKTYDPANLSNLTGQQIYTAPLDEFWQQPWRAHPDSPSPKNMADVLREAGIPGIRYLDQGSRGAGEGTYNHVVFDPATIEILRKYGIAGLMGGGAAAAGAQGGAE